MATDANIETRIVERRDVTRSIFEEEIAPADVPVVLKGLVNDWPVVRASARSHDALGAYPHRARASQA